MNDILDLSLVELVTKVKKKELSSKEITKTYVERCLKSKKLILTYQYVADLKIGN